MEEKRYKIVVDISKDKQEAYLSLIEDPNGVIISKDSVMTEITKHNVIYGIKQDVIEHICQNPQNVKGLLIAQGKKPVNGENGKIIFEVDIQTTAAPKVLEDGSVDYKNLDLFKNIKKGQIIARKINPTEGQPGINVLGQKIEPIRGKDVRLPVGKNTFIDGDKLIAATDGHIVYLNNKIEVHTLLEVKEVDTSVGNINTVASVKITGNVKSGFTVESEGNIEIFGVVEAAIIIANGNIIIHKGVQGNGKAKIVSGRDVTAKYLQNCSVESEGDVYSEAIIYSNVKACGSVKLLGFKSQIIGSKVIAAKEISAANIGSKMGTYTELQVGILPQTRMKIAELTLKIEQNNEAIDKIKKIVRYLEKFEQLPPDKAEIYQKAKASLKDLVSINHQLTEELSLLNNEIKNSSHGIIKVFDTVFPGTKLVINDAVLKIKEPIKYAMFVRDGADIKFLPLT
ncbi:hypothetical protein TKV_c13310 [Thermoanaerobacter kivui]|uniref:Flagellar Assembly Protein A N-terminal region domain-containing protein n=1 Tax=Thermoanaerobacter kivui TaxID=2325 RepID=A0A097ARS0_THEKI|nr:FapA family protein [Thermoanaerobacter kivui]AIS52502.1 hypothetical protein TKV_c13310 [Thermoanaerobacter kivui]